MAVERTRRVVEVGLALAWLGLLAHAVLPDDGIVASVFDVGVYNGLMAAAGVSCLVRAVVVAHDRLSWLMIGGALALWAGGDLYYLVRLDDLPVAPVPSVADGLYLAYFPLMYVGVVLLMRRRLSAATRSLWIDGISGALCVAAIAASLLVGAVRTATDGPLSAIVPNLAYPLGDVVLLGLLAGLAVAQGFRLDRAAQLLLGGLALATISDALYLARAANDAYQEGGAIDVLTTASLLLIAAAGWRDRSDPRAARPWRAIAAMPLACGATAGALMVSSGWIEIGTLGLGLAGGTLASVLARLALTLRENRDLLDRASDAAATDALTGLLNRRALVRDLDLKAASASPARPLALALFDLNGFKRYNDCFGHPAGDALLQRLATRLQRLTGAGRDVYRLGGDEFCLLAEARPAQAAHLVDEAVAALSEQGEGFEITAAFGAVFLPDEAKDATEALRIADIRLYSSKADYYAGHDAPHEELLGALDSRDPQLARQRHLAAELATRIAAVLGLDLREQQRVRRATLLRDIGTLAVPDEIVGAMALDEPERRLFHHHPVIGERIVASLHLLRPLAPIIRSSHEHWDGSGYPFNLAGAEIPLSARIVKTASDYAALLQAGLTGADARAELGRVAATHHDPVILGCLERLGELVTSRDPRPVHGSA